MTRFYLNKAKYVAAQRQTREHICHWPGCRKQVPPAQWGCKRHWFMLPQNLRDAIWAAYRPGQERNLTPSKFYLDTAHRVEKWIQQNAEYPTLVEDV